MATFKISSSGAAGSLPSVFTSSGIAFAGDTEAADTLIVDADAFLISTYYSGYDTQSSGAWLQNTGAWTVNVAGQVAGVNYGIRSEAGGSKITIGSDASVIATGPSGFGVSSVGASTTIINNGEIAGFVGISLLAAGNNVITNSGTIHGNVVSVEGAEKVTNSGTLFNSLLVGGGNDTVTNSGIISGLVDLGSTSSGETNSLTNSGTIGGEVKGSMGIDTVKNTGTITGLITLGDGNDIFVGGATAETVNDIGSGTDKYALGGGNDTFYAAGGTVGQDVLDTVDGGTGVDTYAAQFSTGVYVNLDSKDHVIPEGIAKSYEVLLLKQTATFISSGATDKVTNFENVNGGLGEFAHDYMFGSSADNYFDGKGGDDYLWGLAGNDTLFGGADSDELFGGAGRDILIGGSQADFFVFQSVSESGVTAATRDTIQDFEFDGNFNESIDLSAIDADTTAGATGDQAFHFIGTNVAWNAGDAGQLRAVWTATGQIIEGDVNGDRKADFSIFIYDGGTHTAFSAQEYVDFYF